MAYSEQLAERIRMQIGRATGWSEKKMFGGLAFMLHGHMCCGILGEELMLRLGVEGAKSALNNDHVRAMDFTGRPMTGMVYVNPKGLEPDTALRAWIKQAEEFVGSLPRRSERGPAAARRRQKAKD